MYCLGWKAFSVWQEHDSHNILHVCIKEGEFMCSLLINVFIHGIGSICPLYTSLYLYYLSWVGQRSEKRSSRHQKKSHCTTWGFIADNSKLIRADINCWKRMKRLLQGPFPYQCHGLLGRSNEGKWTKVMVSKHGLPPGSWAYIQ